MVKQRELEALVLLTLYEYFQKNSDHLSLPEVASLIKMDISQARVGLALGALEDLRYVMSSRVMISGQITRYWLTDEGYKYAEDLAERAEASSIDPFASFDAKLAPATDRLVSFGDNQSAKQQAISTIEEAEEIIRSSNQLDEVLKEQTLLSIRTGRNFLERAEQFAIGAFKFLIWDRLKSVIEAGIEQMYKMALTALAMTLGAIIVGLL